MKLVIAVIRPEKLDDVREALVAAEITRITVTRATGHGQYLGEDLYRGQIHVPDLYPKVRLEIACNDEFVEIIIDAILRGARQNGGKVGDGKILVVPLEQCIRIRTGERGGSAI